MRNIPIGMTEKQPVELSVFLSTMDRLNGSPAGFFIFFSFFFCVYAILDTDIIN